MLQHLYDQLSHQVRILGRTTGEKWVIKKRRTYTAYAAMILPVGRGRIAQDQLQRIRRRPHVQVGVEEAGTVLIVILQGMTSHVLAGDNALAVRPLTGEGQTAQ